MNIIWMEIKCTCVCLWFYLHFADSFMFLELFGVDLFQKIYSIEYSIYLGSGAVNVYNTPTQWEKERETE